MVRRALSLLLLGALALVAQAQERTVKTPYTFRVEGLEVRVQNLEVTRDRRYVLVHAWVRSLTGQRARAVWQGWFTVLTVAGEALRPSSDCGVDSGTGLHITTGEFEVERKPSRMLVYFPLSPGELPIRLQFADGACTAPTSR